MSGKEQAKAVTLLAEWARQTRARIAGKGVSPSELEQLVPLLEQTEGFLKLDGGEGDASH